MEHIKSFESVLYGISPRIRRCLEFLPDDIKNKTEEIRLRANLPVCLTVKGEPLFVLKNGGTSGYICADLLKTEKSELEESFLLLCSNSVYAHAPELKSGYITMKSGHRAGVCGTFTSKGVLQDITSINIRISREVKGCADCIIGEYDGGGFLIAGPPGCGKTTMLRDFVRQLSSGKNGSYLRVSVIDSRGEISGSAHGEQANDLGSNTDVLLMKDKAAGVEIAVRTLFPDIVAFDEIGTAAELKSVSESFNAGVSVITTAHIGSVQDLVRRSVTNGLLLSGAISKIAVLSPQIGKKPFVLSAEDLLCEPDN